MEVYSQKAYNPKVLLKIKLGKRLTNSYSKTNKNLCWVEELRPEILEDFIEAFQKRLIGVIGDNLIEINLDHISELIMDMKHLSRNPELSVLLTRYIIHELEIPIELENLEQEIEIPSFNHFRENERLRYYLAKACPDILGEEKGIEFWKDIVTLMLRDERVDYEVRMATQETSGEKEISMIDRSDETIKHWTDAGLADFTRAILDDHKILYRFDKCLIPEVLKDLKDPTWAYLSSCYIGDAPGFNFRIQYMRRTQTLHTAPFCDEMYWDPKVHDEPEQPSLEFTKNLA